MADAKCSARGMRTLGTKISIRIAYLALAIGLVSCGRESKIGRVKCDSSKAFSISATVSSKDWSSRHVFFRPNNHDGYLEPIYEATVSSVLTNAGKEPFMVTATWANLEAKSIAPGASLELPSQPFKNYRIIVIPWPEHDASIDFNFSLDQSVTTDSSWSLVAAWSDGP